MIDVSPQLVVKYAYIHVQNNYELKFPTKNVHRSANFCIFVEKVKCLPTSKIWLLVGNADDNTSIFFTFSPQKN